MKTFVAGLAFFLTAVLGSASGAQACTDEAGELYHPLTGVSVEFTNGCQKNALLAQGYLLRPVDPTLELTAVGTLTTDVMAVGGESTGVIITTESGIYELELTPALLLNAEALNGQQVIVRGNLTEFEGIEVPLRRVVAVKSLKAYKF